MVFFFLLAFSLYYYLVFEKQMEKIRYLKGQISQRDVLVREMYQKNYHNVSDMENKIKDYDQMIAKVYELVPNIKDTPGLLVDFHRLLTENRLTADNITFGQLKAQQNYSTFTLGLKVKGLATDVQSFLKAIEKYKRAVNISKVDFTPTEGGLLESTIELTVYVMHDILPDPQEYPFTGEQQGQKNLFDMFKAPETKAGGGGGQTNPLNPADYLNQLFKMNPGGGGWPQIPAPPDKTPPKNQGGSQPSGAAPQGQGTPGSGTSPQGKAPGGENQTKGQNQGQAPDQTQQEGKTVGTADKQAINPAIPVAAHKPPAAFMNRAIVAKE